jgi:hypothetical protein
MAKLIRDVRQLATREPYLSTMKVQLRIIAGILFAHFAFPHSAAGQAPAWISAGSDADEYLRVAQLAGGLKPTLSLNIRALRNASDQRFDEATHPWKTRWTNGVVGSRWFSLLPTESRTIVNTTFPFGYNDGAIWAGKGLTQSIQAGIMVRTGPVSLILSPIAFVTQNLPYKLMPAGFGPAFPLASPIVAIDAPQRFGERTYGRVDPGQSTLEISLASLSAGLSTANEIWGPGLESPLILGTNAPGIPRLFIGSRRPVESWIGSLEGRVFWGRSTTSDYIVGSFGGQHKFATGIVGSWRPRGLPNLMLGGSRFFHLSSDRGLPPRFWTRVVQGFVQTSLGTSENPLGDDPSDNQLASLFMRWAFPGSGFEVFGEVGREDTSYDLRDLMLQLYHDMGYLVGGQRVWRSPDSLRYAVLRIEVLNTRIGPLYQAAPQVPWYTHDYKGHTERGQVLGAPFGAGGGSFMMSLTRYTPVGWRRVSLNRLMTREALSPSFGPVADQAGVIVAVATEQMRFGSSGRPDIALNLTLARQYGSPKGTGFNVTAGLRASLPH